MRDHPDRRRAKAAPKGCGTFGIAGGDRHRGRAGCDPGGSGTDRHPQAVSAKLHGARAADAGKRRRGSLRFRRQHRRAGSRRHAYCQAPQGGQAPCHRYRYPLPGRLLSAAGFRCQSRLPPRDAAAIRPDGLRLHEADHRRAQPPRRSGQYRYRGD